MALQSCFCLVFVAIMLTVQLHCAVGDLVIQDLRLNGSQSSYEGRVEVQVEGSWYRVCRNGWGDRQSNATCRQLWFPGGRIMTDDEAAARSINEGNLDFLPEQFECEDDSYLGCYRDNSERIFPHNMTVSDAMTSDVCIQHCSSHGHQYAATQFFRQCFCGSHENYLNLGGRLQESQCNSPCEGDSDEMCGGTWRMSVYRIDHSEDFILSECDTDSYEIGSCDGAAKVICEVNMTSTTFLPSFGPGYNTTLNGQTSTSSRKQSQQFPTAVVSAAVGTVLGLLLLLAVLVFCICRRRARSQEDNMTPKLDKDTDQVGMGELGTAQHDDDEHDYSTIPDLQSSPTGGRVDERAPAPPPSQTDVYYSVVRDNGAASPADQTGTAVVNKNLKKDPKTEGKGNNQSGTVDNVIYESY